MLTRFWYLPLFYSQLCGALLEESFVAFSSTDGAIPIHNAGLAYDGDDPVGVEIAIESLTQDFEDITGKRPSKISLNLGGDGTSCDTVFDVDIANTLVVAATANSTLAKKLVECKLFDISEIEGKWESFKTALVKSSGKDALVIVGSDKRGTMFGVYTLAQQAGQSPYHWWADVAATKHDEIYALDKTTVHGEPSVKYRGLFINDEAPALTGWWSNVNNVTHQPLNSEFYRHVFDLLLRLRANFLWPAMWYSYVPKPGNIFFTDDPLNQQLANDYGIVVSTSHHEPMQRATNEWDQSKTGPWDWTKNKNNVTKFMDEGVRRAGKNETYFTLGMRGPSDSPISAPDPIAVLREVFNTQRKTFEKYYGDASAVPQMWTVYKEVATYYAAGLDPPEDVTITVTDDNFGNIQRLPIDDEAKRAGGFGLYYHLEYVGVPKSYKWQNTNNLPKIYKELSQALERGVDRVWVINVADIKPMEVPFGFIMELAWDATKISFHSISSYLKKFAAREFGEEHAEEIGDILFEHSRLVGRRKYESTSSSTYSILHYRENERVLKEWEALSNRILNLRDQLPESIQPAFFHLVYYPIQSGYLYHAVTLGQGTNRQYSFERRNSANAVAEQVLADFDKDFDLLEEYDALVGGKWKGILAQPKYDMAFDSDWKETSRDVVANLSYIQLRQNPDYEVGALGIYAEGSSSAVNLGRFCASIDVTQPTRDQWSPVLPVLTPYGPSARAVDIFHRGDHRVPVSWSLSIPDSANSWLSIKPASGVVDSSQSQQRLNVSVDWDKAPEDYSDTITVRVDFNVTPFWDELHVPVRATRAPSDFTGFPDAGGIISIEAAHFQRSEPDSDANVNFTAIPYLGTRTESGAIALRPYTAARGANYTSPDDAPRVEYGFYLFDDVDDLDATVYVTTGLDSDPRTPMGYSLVLDAGEPAGDFTRVLRATSTAGDLPPEWNDQVRNNVWTLKVELGKAERGSHTLKWSANLPEVYLEKIVLDTGGLKDSYLGPPETKRV
ncbi:glycoside hydrolase family 115 protein [Daldinia bambusicola]|nr:glycoside hydrolase family 115 protein [Daldinia bambusicola]